MTNLSHFKSFRDVQKTSTETSRFLSDLENLSSVHSSGESPNYIVSSQMRSLQQKSTKYLYSTSKKRNSIGVGVAFSSLTLFAVLVAISSLFPKYSVFLVFILISYVFASVRGILR